MLPFGLSARFLLPLFIVTAHAPALFAQAGGPYELRWSTIDGGGGSAAGGTYRAVMTIGQPDAGVASGGSYFLAGGFWGGINAIESTPTATATGLVPSTPTATAPPSPTRTATTEPTVPGTTPTPSVTTIAATRTPSSSPTASGSPSATPTPTASPTPSPTPPACAGDCDHGGSVTVDELLEGVNIALGTISIDACSSFDANGDGAVTVDELLAAVNHALTGCAD